MFGMNEHSGCHSLQCKHLATIGQIAQKHSSVGVVVLLDNKAVSCTHTFDPLYLQICLLKVLHSCQSCMWRS